VHGDTPDAVTIASRVREGLEASGVSVRPALAP
jgi:lactam utilization protein B